MYLWDEDVILGYVSGQNCNIYELIGEKAIHICQFFIFPVIRGGGFPPKKTFKIMFIKLA